MKNTQRYELTSERTQGENWHYIHDTVTGGFVDLFPNLAKAQERCKALNDGRIAPSVYRPLTNIARIVARQIGGEL